MSGQAEVQESATHIARCPEHGLHGERTECFVCGGPVEQVAFFLSSAVEDLVATLERIARFEHVAAADVSVNVLGREAREALERHRAASLAGRVEEMRGLAGSVAERNERISSPRIDSGPADQLRKPTPDQVERVRERHQEKRAVRGPEPMAERGERGPYV